MRNLEENHKSTVCLHSLPVRGPPMDRFLSQSMKISETTILTIFEEKNLNSFALEFFYGNKCDGS